MQIIKSFGLYFELLPSHILVRGGVAICHCSHNLRKFPQIYAVSIGGGVLGMMGILCILFKSLLLSHSQPPTPCRNKNIEVCCESATMYPYELAL